MKGLLISLTGFALVNLVNAAPDATQVIPLAAGWNLVSIQVGNSFTPAQFKDSTAHPDRVQQIWSYNPTGNPAVPGAWDTFQPLAPPEFPSDVTEIVPGKGYWVKVSQSTTATLVGPTWNGAVSLVPGWNLVGFPGLFASEGESQEISGIFGSSFARIQQVWTYDGTSKQFAGYDLTAVPVLKALSTVSPGHGYWVYSLDPLSIQPGTYLALPQDADASPLEPEVDFNVADFPGLTNPADYNGSQVRKVRSGSEDVPFDLNGNGIIDGPFTQDTLRFEVGVGSQVVTIGNHGIGIVNWSLDVAEPWLFTAQADAKLYPGNAGRPQSATGIVSADRDFVTLYVDRAGLPPGTLTGEFTLYLGSTARRIRVELVVPAAAGDWKGLATTTRVNGRSTSVGAVDLFLDLFMQSDNAAETRFRAVLNKDYSLLFPRDVFMNGVFYSGNDFSLTTNFEMPAGDRNAPPFDKFQHVAPGTASNGRTLPDSLTARGDRDWNNNKKLDSDNPFPFPVRREITLLGSRVDPDRMEGTYVESITGMLPGNQPIFIEGTFSLDRQSYTPSRRSIFNQTVNPITRIGGSTGTPYRESTITVSSPVSIQGLTLTLGIDFPSPSGLVITLTSPTGKVYTAHRNGVTLGTTFSPDIFNNTSGQGVWKLRVAWDPASGERGYLNSWGINIEGLATYNVSGTVVKADRTPLPGARVLLSGSNILEQAVTAANGSFAITGLTENNYTLDLSLPGYQSRDIPFYLTTASINVGALAGVGNAQQEIVLSPVVVPESVLVASPWIGADPLFARFELQVPPADLVALGSPVTASWDFGDGSSVVGDTDDTADDMTATLASHAYTNAGHFTATVTLTGPGGSLSRSTGVHVLQTKPDTTAGASTHQLVATGFIGSFAAPLSDAGNPVQVADTGTVSQSIIVRQADGSSATVSVDAPKGAVYQESKRDPAAFDIDRYPLRPPEANFHTSAEDSDFFVQTGTPFHDVDAEPADGVYSTYVQPSVGGQQIPDRFGMCVTLGGFVFGLPADPAPARVGNFVLQTGRIEP